MSQLVIRGRKVVGGVAEGEALVIVSPYQLGGGVHALKGIITEDATNLTQSFKNKVLVFPIRERFIRLVDSRAGHANSRSSTRSHAYK